MKPEQLNKEAKDHVEAMGSVALGDPETAEHEAAVSKLKQRIDETLERVEAHLADGQYVSCQFDKEVVERPLPDGGAVRVTKRILMVITDADQEVVDLAPNSRTVNQVTWLGVHDIEFRQPDGSWWQRGKVESCDVITEFVADLDGWQDEDTDEPEQSDPFEGFQTLERLNWQDPVFYDDSSEDLTSPRGVYVTGQAKATAIARQREGWRGTIEGIIAALDVIDQRVPKSIDNENCSVSMSKN